MVCLTGSKEPGCNMAATVHPPTSNTGAAADESTPHHGTSRTRTTIANPVTVPAQWADHPLRTSPAHPPGG